MFALPIPDETLLTIAGYMCSSGELRLTPTILTAFLGASAGITVSYALGRLGGPAVMRLLGRRVLTPQRLERGHHWFERSGKWSLLFGYYIPGVRHLIGFAAGTAGLELHTFLIFACAGTLTWSAMFVLAGYAVARGWGEWIAHARTLSITVGVVAVAASLVGGMIWKRRHRPRL